MPGAQSPGHPHVDHTMPDPTVEEGYEALRSHLVERALMARDRYGPSFDLAAIDRLLEDRELVRFPARIEFDAQALMPGEFGWAKPLGDRPSDGFALTLHPSFEEQPEIIPLLVAYHLVSINYLDLATHEEAELFGATLLGMEVDAYYDRLCELVDGLSE